MESLLTKKPANSMSGSRNSGSTVRAMLMSWKRQETKMPRAAPQLSTRMLATVNHQNFWDLHCGDAMTHLCETPEKRRGEADGRCSQIL